MHQRYSISNADVFKLEQSELAQLERAFSLQRKPYNVKPFIVDANSDSRSRNRTNAPGRTRGSKNRQKYIGPSLNQTRR